MTGETILFVVIFGIFIWTVVLNMDKMRVERLKEDLKLMGIHPVPLNPASQKLYSGEKNISEEDLTGIVRIGEIKLKRYLNKHGLTRAEHTSATDKNTQQIVALLRGLCEDIESGRSEYYGYELEQEKVIDREKSNSGTVAMKLSGINHLKITYELKGEL